MIFTPIYINSLKFERNNTFLAGRLDGYAAFPPLLWEVSRPSITKVTALLLASCAHQPRLDTTTC